MMVEGWEGAASSQLPYTGKGASTVGQVGSAGPSGRLLTLPSVFTIKSVSLRAPTSRSENVDNNCIFRVGNGSHSSTSHRRGKQARRNTGKRRGLERNKKGE